MNPTEEQPIPKTGNDILRDKDQCIEDFARGIEVGRKMEREEMIEKLKKAGIDLANLQ